MAPLTILLAAAAAAPAEAPPHTYLSGAAPREACGEPAGDDVVVCGKREAEEQYRLRPLADGDRYEPKPIRAQLGLGGGSMIGMTVQDKALTAGQRSQRAMVTIGIPF